MATSSNPITDGVANCRRSPAVVATTTLYLPLGRQPAITFLRRVPAAVAAVPQSAYRTFMRPSKHTRVRLHAICDQKGARRCVGRARQPPVRRGHARIDTLSMRVCVRELTRNPNSI